MKTDRSDKEDLFEILDKLEVSMNEELVDPLASLKKTLAHIDALMLSAEYKKALKILNPILKDIPNLINNKKYTKNDIITLISRAADCNIAIGKQSTADKIFEKYSKLFNNSGRYWVEKANYLVKTNRALSAINMLEDKLNDGSIKEPIEILSTMTDIFENDDFVAKYDDYRLLINHVERLIKRNPNDVTTLDLCAFAFYQKGEYVAALEMIRRLIISNPFDPQNHFKRGVIYEEQGKLPLAIMAYTKAISLDEEDGDISSLAMQMIISIDQRQLRQISERAATDQDFYKELKRSPEQTILKNGYFLSPYGLQFLHTLDIHEKLN